MEREDTVSAPASNGSSEKPSTSGHKTAPRPKRKRIRKRARAGFAEDEEAQELKKRLLKRSDKDRQTKGSKNVPERGPVIVRKGDKCNDQEGFDKSTYEIANPSTYDKLFARLEETHFNKVAKPDGKCVENAPWVCCFCFRKPCVDDLGDLFGPYYVKLSYPSFWPPFVQRPDDQKRAKETTSAVTKPESEVNVDLWFHGDCVFWAPEVLLRGWGMTGLEEHLPKYWGQKCTRCHETGATMVCTVKGCNRRFHFPCAVQSGCDRRESHYAMYCDLHKKTRKK